MQRIPPGFSFDDLRGNLSTIIFGKNEQVPFRPVQALIVHNKAGVFRGLHYQTKRPMRKAVFCLAGRITDFAYSFDGHLGRMEVSPELGGVLISANEAHGYHSYGESTVLYFYDRPFLKDHQAGINPRAILERYGIKATLSKQDEGWLPELYFG